VLTYKRKSFKMEELLKQFKLSKEQYHDIRTNMQFEDFLFIRDINGETVECSALYFDSDDGVALIKHDCQVFEEEGFSIELIDCKYCDIKYKHMQEIMLLIKDSIAECKKQNKRKEVA